MNRYLIFATFIYWLFVIYGSLVPLEYKFIPFETALSQFTNIKNLNLGAESRADWIANIVLYIPLAFMASASFSGIRYSVIRAFMSILVLLFCLATAVGIEFTQLYFPQRTVSVNDLVAETLGSVTGVLGWQFFGAYFAKLYAQMLRGSLLSVRAAIIFYLLAYIALSLFPFDFVTSSDELSAKLAQGRDALILPFEVCVNEPLRCAVKLLAEMLVLMPLGLLFGYSLSFANRLIVALVMGFFLGLGIELTQVFLISGNAQGLSVLMRMAGIGLGVTLYGFIKKRHFSEIAPYLRRSVGFVVLPYLLLVLSINGWFAETWLSNDEAMKKLADTHFLPLYYFYFTSESVAFFSLLSNIGLYLPVGLLCWAGFANTGKGFHWFTVGGLAAIFALIVEIGKLYLPEKHADPSDVWLAFIAAAACYELMGRLVGWLRQDKTLEPPVDIPVAPTIAVMPEKTGDAELPAFPVAKGWRLMAGLVWLVLAWGIFVYPIAPVALGLFLIAYIVLLVRWPFAWLIVIPALLPLMDFTPWTGRFFFDEFDLLILATLGFYFWQKPKVHLRSLLSIPSLILLTLFSIFHTVSLFKGLLPVPELSANAFNNYYSSFNGLRVAKGFFWSLLLLPLLQVTIRRYRNSYRYFAYGILLGLAGVSVFAVIERMVFVSLFDFASDYRINGMFSTMHAGGGHFESYLMLAFPFIALLMIHIKPSFMAMGLGLFGLGVYALLATYSRGGLIGFAVAFVMMLLALLVSYQKQIKFGKTVWVVVALVLLSGLLAIPMLTGSMFQQRLEVVAQDRDSREFHWEDALAMRDDDVLTSLFGMGLGSYPRTFFWLNNENIHPGTYEIATENDNRYLRLRGGDAMFLGQYLKITPHTAYRLVLDVRGDNPGLVLSTSLCEKSVQYSVRCSAVDSKISQSEWQHIEQTFDSGAVGEPVAGGLLIRPIQLAFFNGNAVGQLVDVDNVQLLEPSGNNLVKNGDFTEGSDYWFFAAERHNPWHIFNFWVHLLFDMGWLGAIAFVLLFINVLFCCYRKLRQQNLFAAIFLTGFTGFMVVGWVDSPFDAPRLTLLFFMLVYLAVLRTPNAWAKPDARRR